MFRGLKEKKEKRNKKEMLEKELRMIEKRLLIEYQYSNQKALKLKKLDILQELIKLKC